jgi:hypothetical protein
VLFLSAHLTSLCVVLVIAECTKLRDTTQGKGRAIAQAVSRCLPTVAARVRVRVWPCGICGGQSGADVGFLRVLQVPLPIFIPPITPQSPPPIIWGWYNRPLVAAVPSGFSLTPLRINIKNTTTQGWSPMVSLTSVTWFTRSVIS